MTTRPRHLSLEALRVLRKFLWHDAFICGADLIRNLDMPSGTVYPLLRSLQRKKFLTSMLEAGDPRVLGRPRKRLYWITRDGRKAAEKVLEELR